MTPQAVWLHFFVQVASCDYTAQKQFAIPQMPLDPTICSLKNENL